MARAKDPKAVARKNPMGMVQVTGHSIHVYQALSEKEWLTAREVSAIARVAERTARHHLSRLVRLGAVNEQRVFGGYRYRMTPDGKLSIGAWVKEMAELFEAEESTRKKAREARQARKAKETP